MGDTELDTGRARALAGAIEPIAGQVYFSPECHRNYEALGFSPSPAEVAGVAMPDGVAYFCSRGSVLGHVPGEVVASAFAVFNPAIVVPLVSMGGELAPSDALCAARTEGAVAQLVRVLGEAPDGIDRATELLQRANAGLRPAGRPLYAGLLALGLPGDPMGDLWRLADRLREFRGDAHTAAWTTAGFDATEIGLLTELYWGLPLRTYIRTRAWSDDELDAAEARLEERGLVAGGAFTPAGRDGPRAGRGGDRRAVPAHPRGAGRRPRRAARHPRAVGRQRAGRGRLPGLGASRPLGPHGRRRPHVTAPGPGSGGRVRDRHQGLLVTVGATVAVLALSLTGVAGSPGPPAPQGPAGGVRGVTDTSIKLVLYQPPETTPSARSSPASSPPRTTTPRPRPRFAGSSTCWPPATPPSRAGASSSTCSPAAPTCSTPSPPGPTR